MSEPAGLHALAAAATRACHAPVFAACPKHFDSPRRIYGWTLTLAPYNKGNMSPTHNPGRVAGFWYLLLIVVGPTAPYLYSQQTVRA